MPRKLHLIKGDDFAGQFYAVVGESLVQLDLRVVQAVTLFRATAMVLVWEMGCLLFA